MGNSRLVAIVLVAVVGAGAVATAVRAGATGDTGVATVKVAYNAKLKTSILVNGSGLTLYAFTSDADGIPTCLNDIAYHCSKAWPPLLTQGAPHAGKGLKLALLRTVKNSDGGMQVAYNRHPLYTDAGAKGFGLVGDRKPGDVNGQNFAGSWYVVSPSGKLIRKH